VNESTELKVKTILARVMRIDVSTITADSSTDTVITWDSLNHMKLVLALEEEFEIAFDATQIEHMTSFAKVISLVGQLQI
jgi:acyl carrier protein